MFALAPREDGTVSGDGEAMLPRSRYGHEALPRQGLDLLRQLLQLLVAVAQLAFVSAAPAPDGAVGGEGEAVLASSRHSDAANGSSEAA